MEANQEEPIVAEYGMFPWRLVVLIILATVLTTTIVVSIAVYMWREMANQRLVDELQRKLELAMVVQQEQDIEVEERVVIPTASVQPVKEGWKTYTHTRYNYKIDYPEGADVAESESGVHVASVVTGVEGERIVEENVPYLDGLCVVIESDFGSVSISAPDNRYVICGPTGVGSDAIDQSKDVIVNGSLLKASGYRGPSQEGQVPDYEWFEFTTDSGFDVVYSVDFGAGDDEFKYEEVKRMVEEMVATFRSIE
jgi:hypothetical protein